MKTCEIKGMVPAICAVLLLTVSSGCATIRHAVPSHLSAKAQIPGMPEVRTFPDTPKTPLKHALIASAAEEYSGEYPPDADGIRRYPMLAISGGSSNGAYGAGLLKGWSKSGTRPSFKVVTGVSTGAIIAPFAFLGKEYDGEIEKFYTTSSTKDIMQAKGPFAILMGDSL